MLFNRINRNRSIFQQQRIRHTVREVTIRLMMQLDEFERKFFITRQSLDPINNRTRATITGIIKQGFERGGRASPLR